MEKYTILDWSVGWNCWLKVEKDFISLAPNTENSSLTGFTITFPQVGYLPDGTPLNRAGNAMNHPEKIAPDTHVDGSFCKS